MGKIGFSFLLSEFFIIINSQFIWTLNEQQQFYAYPFTKLMKDFEEEEFLLYGMWSRYIPLSTISQTGTVGIFDSPCYNLNSVQEIDTKRVNFIYYDCINTKEMTVKKIIQFLSNEGKQYNFEIKLDSMKYEYFWYFFAVHSFPHKNTFTYYILQGVTTVDIQQSQVQFPYYDEKLLIIFGGGLILREDETLKIEDVKNFSYFPGQISLLAIFKGSFNLVDLDLMLSFQSMFNDKCYCIENQIKNLPDTDINWLEQKIFASTQRNCDSFAYQSWIKIKQVIQYSSEFVYQLLKLSSNFENPKLRGDNLSALQVYYIFGSQKYQLKFTTYSYTFPYYNLDFSANRFLIEQLFDIPNINLWHFITVKLKNNFIEMKVTFYEGNQLHKFECSYEVKQFHMVQYKLQYGNILQSASDYFTVYLRNQQLFNCVQDDDFSFEQKCHHSCQDCDGPTNTDCLSCSEISRRIYISIHKACVCPYDTIDQQDCKDYQSYNLNIIQEQEDKCHQGYFEYKQNCFQCPSVISQNLITCLECIQDPQNWMNDPYCETNLVLDNNGSPAEFIKDQSKVFYVLDENNIKPCNYDQNRNLQSIDEIYEDYLSSNNLFLHTCSNALFPQYCYPCNIMNCQICGFQQSKTICLKCSQSSDLINGLCIKNNIGQIEYNKCLTPYYITSQKGCSLCEIENCLYCFEYESNDLTKCTLYSDFESFEIDEYHTVGCALCKDGFIFDFRKGLCLYQKSSILNCLRAFINLQGQEICTLSGIDDFSIAPEIIDCQKYITNCKQCYQTPLSIIKCIICEDGYSSSISTGHCSICNITNIKYCIEGDFFKLDAWMQLLQSFLMKFLPNSYIYPQTTNILYTSILPIKCIDGYEINVFFCQKYCDPNCSVCKKIELEGFYCAKCNLNYYMEPMRVKDYERCIPCPQLCQVCQPRTQQEIQKINPYFLNSNEYPIFTYKCIKSIPHQDIFINPYNQIAKYCYNQQCNSFFQFQLENSCDGLYIAFYQPSLQQLFDFIYLNQIAFDNFQLTLPFQNDCQGQEFQPEAVLNNIFKQQIFSMQFVELIIQGNRSPSYFYKAMAFTNFDKLNIKNTTFLCKSKLTISLRNEGNPQNLIISDSEFINQENLESQLQLISTNYQKLYMKNIKFQNLNLKDISIFEFIPFEITSSIFIEKFIIEKCSFTNSTLFNFLNFPNVIIIELIIENSQFSNSTIANFEYDIIVSSNISFKSITISNSVLSKSFIFKNADTITLNQISIIQNTFEQSTILEFKNIVFINNLLILNNNIIQSQLIFKIETTLTQSKVIINLLNYNNNSHNGSSIFSTDFSISNDLLSIVFMNFELNENKQNLFGTTSPYLFYINCYNLSISNLHIGNSDNFNYFNFITISIIKIENAVFSNIQKLKVPLSIDCINSFNQNNQIFYIQGFNSIELKSITIKYYNSIDQSFIQIFSNVLNSKREIIIIQDLTFIGNILLKINLRNLFSLISIYSEKNQLIQIQNIQFQQNLFHQYIDDSSQNAASLLFINSQQSSVLLSNLNCYQNVLTNSTSSFILINSKIINIAEYQIQNHNIINIQILYLLFDFQLDQNLSQNQINQVLAGVLKIQIKEGVLFLTAEQCYLTDGKLKDILTFNSLLLNLHTQGDGIIKLQNLEIASIESLDLQNSENDGCITITSYNSLLKFELINFLLIEVLNKFASPIIYIIPSQNKNQIIIRNVTMLNCFSLTNILLKSQFSLMSVKKNKVQLENIKIKNDKQDLFQYILKFNSLDSIDIQRILNDNAIIILQNCIISIKEFVYEGVLLSTIFKFIDPFRIQIEKIYFYQIQMILYLDLIQVGQSFQNQYSIKMQDLKFINIDQFDVEEFKNLSTNYYEIEIFNKNCSVINEVSVKTFKISDFRYYQFFQQLIKDSSQQGSIMYFQSKSNFNKIYLSQISVINMKSQKYVDAILYFEMISFLQIDINEFYCLWNNINLYGCILLKSNEKQNSTIRISNSLFYSNIGGYGTGITTQNVNLKLQSSKFLYNYAQYQGGGLNLQLDENEFIINNSFIQLNQANEAGGLYLQGQSKLNQSNFQNSIISFNKANITPQNLQELPTFLSLSINEQDAQSIQKVVEKKQINMLQLQPYFIIEQGKKIMTKVLVIPSNQKIKNYLLFNPNDQSFQKYIYEFSISFKNSFNEKLINFINSTCKIEEQIFEDDKLESQNITHTIQFKTSLGNFDLSELQFSFDPFIQDNKQQYIFITCRPNNSYSELYYSLQVTTLKCQLGEFYIQNSCQSCSSNQGYYSVTYNSTKCSIFDQIKFENITSNQIYLKVGYWRPNQYSDDIEYCFKYPNICRGGWFVGDQLCNQGFIGGLCEECDKYNIRGFGYYFKNQYNLDCHLCDELSNSIILFIVAFLWSLISTLLTLSSIDKSNKLFTSCKLKQKFSNIIFKLNQDHGSILIKLFLNYLWIFSAIFSFNINFTFSFSFIDQTSNPSYFMANNLDCYLTQINNVELIYIRIIAMFLLMICLLIAIYLGFTVVECIYKRKFDASIISISALYLYVSNYATLIKQFFSLLAKRQISNIPYIQGDVSLIFGTSNHISWIVSFIIPGLGIIGWLLPFSLLLLLYIKRDKIESTKFRKHFCYLFNEYNNQNFFWEWVKLAQKTFVIIVLTYFETNTFLKASLLGLCLLFYQLYALEQQPYIIKNFNKLDIKAGQICSISIFLAVIKYICEQQDNQILSFILQMILVFLSIKLSFPFIKSLLKLYHKKYKKQFLIQLSKLFQLSRCTAWIDVYLKKQFLVWNQKELRLRSHFFKLRQHLIYISKLQIEQQRSLSTLFSSDSMPRYRSLYTEQNLLKLRQCAN